MYKPLHPMAIFRLSVLGPLASRTQLEHGELQKIIRELANKTYHIPGTQRVSLSPQAIERWYYTWKQGGIDALAPKERCDKHRTQLSETVQRALITAKKEHPSRSLNTLIAIVEKQGIVERGKLARATVHRFLQRHQLSKRTAADAATIERRSFVAEHCNDIWHGDVMHGPSIPTTQGRRKTYLISFLDDTSRLITHATFCLGETALDVEGVLKQAVLKRGLPKKIILDNGAAYRSHSLQGICARLGIHLVYCRPYEPEGKGKLERFHRTFREQFLDEIDWASLQSLNEANARLWVWIEQIYHRRLHQGLQNKMTPLSRFTQDLVHIKSLSMSAHTFDDLFYHRHKRKIRKDGTAQWEGKLYEVSHQYAGKEVVLVVDPHESKTIRIESSEGENLGPITLLDRHANLHRQRQRPAKAATESPKKYRAVDMAYEDYQQQCGLGTLTELEDF